MYMYKLKYIGPRSMVLSTSSTFYARNIRSVLSGLVAAFQSNFLYPVVYHINVANPIKISLCHYVLSDSAADKQIMARVHHAGTDYCQLKANIHYFDL